ncbi:MAG: rhomboid family intramembrane serine protease [Peptococcaceae bacterium]|nr:rhomboid family intramembrane serine protease [Peptococcaceae bacterium]
MIPLRDTIRSRRFPVVTVTIITLNVIVFLYELSLGSATLLHRFASQYGMIPAVQLHMIQEAPFSLSTWSPMVTSMFIHGGLMHIIGNMLYLWVFGDNVEDVLGKARFVAFYLLAGIAGNIGHLLANPASTVPTIGASGAVAGVLGAYFITFPRSRILALVPFLFIITFMELPAVLFLFLWFGLQLLNGLAALAIPATTVAWWAHIGGFGAGMIMIKLLRQHHYRKIDKTRS